jgi:hypothetical protein
MAKIADWSQYEVLGVPQEKLDTEAQQKKLEGYQTQKCVHNKDSGP